MLNGKHILAPPKDISELKNAYEIYRRLDELNPYLVNNLLTTHGIMTRCLVKEFCFLPAPSEFMTHDRQQKYYEVINASNDARKSMVFIELMLSAIKTSLIDVINTSGGMSDGKVNKALFAEIKFRSISKLTTIS